jgi:hypothetical protein
MALWEYDGRDSAQSNRSEWSSRRASVASSSGTLFTATGVGQVYAVGQITDHGNTFTDSVLVTVVAPTP